MNPPEGSNGKVIVALISDAWVNVIFFDPSAAIEESETFDKGFQ